MAGVYVFNINWATTTLGPNRHHTVVEKNGIIETENITYGAFNVSTADKYLVGSYVEICSYHLIGSSATLDTGRRNKCTLSYLG